MYIVDFLRLSNFITDCPNCDSNVIGNGEGTLNVENTTIKRTCKCGFQFEYDIKNGKSKKKIQQAIKVALNNI